MIDESSPILSVSDLNRMARLALERALPIAWVGGEISNLARAPSGHWYFTLKDANASVRCAMFRNRNQFVDWRPENGMQVEVRAQATLYEPRGEFQLTVEAMRRAGLGALFEAFQKLKERLEREGLFAAEGKHAIPEHPGRIGIVTSPKAAALRDVLTTLRRRWPLAGVCLFPTPVQGTGAAARIAAAIDLAGRRGECDVLLVVRGGGSLEDLWAFNEEPVVRAIANCPTPVISGVGHETDFTLADFAADLRAPTPTAAAQLATPDQGELSQRTGKLGQQMRSTMRRKLDFLGQRLDGLHRRLAHPAARIEGQARHVDHLTQRLILAQQGTLARRRLLAERLADRLVSNAPDPATLRVNVEQMRRRLSLSICARLHRHVDRVDSLSRQLAHLDPQAVLNRGYSIVRDDAGSVIQDSRQVALDSGISVTLAHGSLKARVIEAKPA